MKRSAVIVAAGNGSRMGAGYNKVYMPLHNKPMLAYTLKAFEESGIFDEIIIVTGRDDFAKAREIADLMNIPCKSVEGGKTRQESVLNGVKTATGDLVAVHDGARALITADLIKEVVEVAEKAGAAALGVPPKNTIKIANAEGLIEATVERSSAYLIQTPQVFKRDELIKAHQKAAEDGFSATDDCAAAERIGTKIKIVNGSYENIKLTTIEDIYTAEYILKARENR